MFDSSRPLPSMPALFPGYRCALTPRAIAPAALRASFLARTALPALALLAAAVPAFASGHHTAAAPRHPLPTHLAHAAVHRAPSGSVRISHLPASHVAASRGHAAGSMATASRSHRHGEEAALTARSRRELEARTERNVTGRHGSMVLTAGSMRHAEPRPPSLNQARQPHTADGEDGEIAANRSTQDRVHAWYQTHTQGGTPALKPVPDVATVAHKATAEDFDRAAAVQRNTIHSVQDRNEHQTTAADDAADAETHIPSTAPTEREPSPFQHGDAAPTNSTAPAHHDAAPVVRQAPATSVTQPVGDLSWNTSPTTKLHATPLYRAEMGAAASRSGVDGRTDAAALKVTPVALAADSSPSAIRAISAETAASPTPGLNLPAPPLSAAIKAAPASAAVAKGARRPKLDATVVQGMAEETFDDDDTPITAKSAVALATTPAAASPAVALARASAAEDDPASAASRAMIPVNLFDGRGHLLLVPPMKGSHEILVHQNQMAVADGLDRIQDDAQLADMRRHQSLIALPDDDSVYPNDTLPENRRYARPWAVHFIRDMARAHYARFGTPLIVTSAARTVEFQRHLVRVNGNAAPPSGDIASPHLYGQAIDFAKHGMSLTEITWMRAYLTPIEAEGKIDVEEEFQQSCFHVSVYRRYLGAPSPKHTAPRQENAPALLDAKSTPATPGNARKSRLPTALLATGLR